MTSVFRISLDIHQTQSQVSIPATQGADNVRLIIRLTEKGNPFDIEDGSYAIFSAVKPDGNPLYNDCAIYRNSTIVYDFTPQTTAVEGVTTCQIHLYDTYGRKLHSPRFMIVVHPDIYDSAMESTAEFSVLSQFIKEKGDLEHDVDQNTEKIANNYQILQSHTKSIALLNPLIPSAVITTIPTTAWEQASKNEPYTATLGEVGDHQHVTIWGLDNVTIEWLNVNRPAVPILNGEIVLTASAKPSKELTFAMLTEPYAVGEEDDEAYSLAELVGLTDEAVRLNLGNRMTLAETRLDSAEVIGGLVEIKASDWVDYGTTINLPIEADTLTLLWPGDEASRTIAEKQGIHINQAFVNDDEDEVLLIRVVKEDYNGALRLRYIRLPMVNEESQQAAVLLIGAKYSPRVGSGGGNGDVVIRPDPHVVLTIAADSWSETKSIGLTTWITGAIPLDDITPQTMIRLSALDAETAADWSAGQTRAEITHDEETETYSLRVGIIGDKPTADWQILMETATVEETEGVTGPWVSVIPPVSDATDKVADHNYDEAAHPDLRDQIKGLDAKAVGADPAGTAESKVNEAVKEINQSIAAHLANYYAKGETYNRTEIDSRLSAIPKFEIKPVDSLPTSGISYTTVYLVKDKTESGDLYTEYIRVTVDGTDVWEELGRQRVDLSGYVTKEALDEALASKVTEERVNALLTDKLKDYLTTAKAQELYQPKGDYVEKQDGMGLSEINYSASEQKRLNQAVTNGADAKSYASAALTQAATAERNAAASAESAEEVQRKVESGELDGAPGAPGYTPLRGVDYWTPEDVAAMESENKAYIIEELAKRNQFVPIPAASVEDMTDTTKIYYLTATGELYAYAPTQVTVGGYEDLADHTSEDWNGSSRFNASSAISAAVYDKTVSFVSNAIPVKPDSEIYIKNVTAPTRTDAGATQFSAVLYDEGGNILNTGKQPMILKEVPGSGFTVTAINQCWNAVTLMADGSYKWRVGASNSGAQTYAAVAYIRVAGVATSSYGDVIITVDEPIVEPTIETVYKWAGTGHFISSEKAITALESRVNELEDKTEELEVTVARLKTNSSISMQSGAVWYAFGDSITEGYISYLEEDGTASSKLEPANQHSWAYTVAKLNGYELTNYGVGGSGYAYGKSGITTAREQVDAVDFTGCDLVTFAWGCNDWKYNAGPIGSKDDDKDTDTTTCAALKWCIERVLSQNPLCKILVITPINVKRGTFEGNYGLSYEMTNTGTLQDVYDAIASVCESYGIEYIDMTHSSVVNRSNISALLLDTVHPTPEAYAAMGKELARKINFA